MDKKRFNIRVYGILINKEQEILLSDERRYGKKFTKFPGGGLQFGEGIKDCLVREFKEELNITITVDRLFYLTDFYQPSAFSENDQIISIYYIVKTKAIEKIPAKIHSFSFSDQHQLESQRWKNLSEFSQKDVTFPIDKKVATLIVKEKQL